MNSLEIYYTHDRKSVKPSKLPDLWGTTLYSGVGFIEISLSRSGRTFVVREMESFLSRSDKQPRYLEPGQRRIISGNRGARLVILHLK